MFSMCFSVFDWLCNLQWRITLPLMQYGLRTDVTVSSLLLWRWTCHVTLVISQFHGIYQTLVLIQFCFCYIKDLHRNIQTLRHVPCRISEAACSLSVCHLNTSSKHCSLQLGFVRLFWKRCCWFYMQPSQLVSKHSRGSNILDLILCSDLLCCADVHLCYWFAVNICFYCSFW